MNSSTEIFDFYVIKLKKNYRLLPLETKEFELKR